MENIKYKEFICLTVIGFTVLFFRNMDPFLNLTLYAEDGTWIAKGLNLGWFNVFLNARPDYHVFINVFILYLSVLLSNITSGNELLHAPFYIAFLSNIFIVLVFISSYFVIKVHANKKVAIVSFFLLLLVPLGGHMNEILGRSLQLGFFCPLLVMNILFLQQKKLLSNKLIFIIIIASLLTSPLVIVPLFVFALMQLITTSKLAFLKKNLLSYLVYLLIFFYLILRIKNASGLSGDNIEHINNVIEYFFARSVFYPFSYVFYNHLTDRLVLIILSILVLISFFILRRRNVQYNTFIVILLCNLILLTFSTWITRSVITNLIYDYQGLFPERYFMASNFIAVILLSFIFLNTRKFSQCFIIYMFLSLIVGFSHIFDFNKPVMTFSKGQSINHSLCLSDSNNVPIYPFPWRIKVPDSVKNSANCNFVEGESIEPVAFNDIKIHNNKMVITASDPDAFILYKLADNLSNERLNTFILDVNFDFNECQNNPIIQVFWFNKTRSEANSTKLRLFSGKTYFNLSNVVEPFKLKDIAHIRIDFDWMNGCSNISIPKLSINRDKLN